jgi:uncharacterized repeat protein (TIGR03803 family)
MNHKQNLFSTPKIAFALTHCTLSIMTMFMLATTSAFAAQETVLASLDTARGRYPAAGLVFDSAGNLYGTTTLGGTHGLGTVFQLQPLSGGGWKTVVVHNFAGGDEGRSPQGPLVVGPDGNLYGVMGEGGAGSVGIVFELSASSGSWKETVIYAFAGEPDAENPSGGLVFDNAGNLYGVAQSGGKYANGAIYELTPANGTWTEAVIYSFGGPTRLDGGLPRGSLVFDASGNLYGTTPSGGHGPGVVFELSPDLGGWTENVIFRFASSGTHTGVIFDNAGNLYGATWDGGRNGDGAVFELTPSGSTWTKKDIHEFSAGADVGESTSILLFANGNLYFTTPGGGQSGLGVVFELTPESGEWKEIVLHPFRGGRDGANPYSGVIMDGAGNLYGTTMFGGRQGAGTVYEVTP